ncbi:NAD-dependent epimerase/dehydratase family protein [Candidatus Kaiserbacteria bacterium]|nr:NAD-dependent epimerase/dehydratase family protein [Candidatus Kaiserbacteria bacterium]
MAKVVVTGGAGFIGSHLVDALAERGDEVHVIDDYAAGKRDDRINSKAAYHEIDIREYAKIAPIISGAMYVFHEAALPRVQFSIENPELTFSVNVGGTVSLLRAAHEGGVKRFVFASSGSVYGDQQVLPLSEELPAQPKSPYGLQKYVGELTCRLWSSVYRLSTVSLRYFNVYGSRMDPNGAYALMIGKFILMRKEGKPLTIWGDGTHTRDFTSIKDVVRANLLAAESGKVGAGEVLNIGAGRNVSVNEVAAMIGGPVVHEQERLEPAHALADNRKAKELLGWTPSVPIEDGIAELKGEAGIA